MLLLDVIAEALAMIREDDDRGAVVQPRAAELGDDLPTSSSEYATSPS